MTSPTRRLAAAVLCAGALTALSACGGTIPGVVGPPSAAPAPAAPAPAGAAPTSSGAEPGTGDDTSVFQLEIGQCVNSETGEGEVSSVPIVECSEPHQAEIYALPQLPDGEFPGDEAVTETAQEECTGDVFTDYVGLPFERSEFEVTFLLPSAETWADGDREIACLIASTEPGSVRGSNR